MIIRLSGATGNGNTEIAAFDEALHEAGISNLNLIYLSSVIPPKSKIIIDKIKSNSKHGDKAYIVIAKRISNKNRKIAAGLGWVQDEKTGEGLFVEITGNTKQEVRREIEETLNHMVKIRKRKFGQINHEIKEMNCKKGYNCVLVVALYKTQGWK